MLMINNSLADFYFLKNFCTIDADFLCPLSERANRRSLRMNMQNSSDLIITTFLRVCVHDILRSIYLPPE